MEDNYRIDHEFRKMARDATGAHPGDCIRAEPGMGGLGSGGWVPTPLHDSPTDPGLRLYDRRTVPGTGDPVWALCQGLHARGPQEAGVRGLQTARALGLRRLRAWAGVWPRDRLWLVWRDRVWALLGRWPVRTSRFGWWPIRSSW